MSDREIKDFFEAKGFNIHKTESGAIELKRGDIFILTCKDLKSLYENYPK